jgi:glycosyltransferase involved in cell wall biosynthesis
MSANFRSEQLRINSLRIAVIGVLEPSSGGAHTAGQLTYDEIVNALRSGDEVVIISNHRDKHYQKLTDRFEKIFIGKQLEWVIRRFNPSYTKSKLERFLLKEGFNLVIFLSPTDEIVHFSKLPCVGTVWDLGHREYPFFPETGQDGEFERRERRVKNTVLKSACVITDSGLTSQRLETQFGADGRNLLPMPFAPSKTSYPKHNRNRYLAFYPAHFWKHKNHQILAKAVRSLLDDGKVPRTIILTGQDRGHLRNFERLIRLLEVEDYFQYEGFVSTERISEIYSTAALCVMPSIIGPTNLPPLEALMHGCPVAASTEAVEGFPTTFPIVRRGKFDLEEWASVLDSQHTFEELSLEGFEVILDQQRKVNIRNLSIRLEEFRNSIFS